jgi:hypothetical protein
MGIASIKGMAVEVGVDMTAVAIIWVETRIT